MLVLDFLKDATSPAPFVHSPAPFVAQVTFNKMFGDEANVKLVKRMAISAEVKHDHNNGKESSDSPLAPANAVREKSTRVRDLIYDAIKDSVLFSNFNRAHKYQVRAKFSVFCAFCVVFSCLSHARACALCVCGEVTLALIQTQEKEVHNMKLPTKQVKLHQCGAGD